MTVQRIVVVGASLAGLRAIETLRADGHAGELVAIGAEPELPYDRPPLSKQFLKGEWDEAKIALRKQGTEDLQVEWRLGKAAASLDLGESALLLEGGERVAYDGLLIATGCVARHLPFGKGLGGVHVLRTLADARALRANLAGSPRVAVVGAGFIGMEVAASCRERGLDVTVIEPLATPLVRGLGETLGSLVAARFREAGVALRLGVGVQGFVGDRQVEGVELSDGKRVPADVVLVAIGVRPATDWLEGSGLRLDNGVVCDGAGVAAPNVMAAGDVASWAGPVGEAPRRHEHWTHAVEQGVHAAKRLLHGEVVEPLDVVPYVWSDQFDMRIAIAGEPASNDQMHVCHGSLEEGRFLALFGREGRLSGAVAFRRPRPLNAARRLIGERASFADAIAANS
ncbi:MAG: FAD-dependent oxidoreductase [Deltaproteobacteria bacterium]|nr:FAD-dependent oxidoreductase [Deltaproteobacteria bacterium]